MIKIQFGKLALVAFMLMGATAHAQSASILAGKYEIPLNVGDFCRVLATLDIPGEKQEFTVIANSTGLHFIDSKGRTRAELLVKNGGQYSENGDSFSIASDDSAVKVTKNSYGTLVLSYSGARVYSCEFPAQK